MDKRVVVALLDMRFDDSDDVHDSINRADTNTKKRSARLLCEPIVRSVRHSTVNRSDVWMRH